MPKPSPFLEIVHDPTEPQPWRWRLKSPNGKITAASSEAFTSKGKARKNYNVVFRDLGRALKTEPRNVEA